MSRTVKNGMEWLGNRRTERCYLAELSCFELSWAGEVDDVDEDGDEFVKEKSENMKIKLLCSNIKLRIKSNYLLTWPCHALFVSAPHHSPTPSAIGLSLVFHVNHVLSCSSRHDVWQRRAHSVCWKMVSRRSGWRQSRRRWCSVVECTFVQWKMTNIR